MPSKFFVSENKSILLWLVLSVMLVCGVYLMVQGFQAVLDAYNSPHWTSVAATMIKSELVTGKSRKPSVLYRYILDGKEFTSTLIAPGVTAYNGDTSQIIRRFPKGTLQTAYVSPDNPSRVFLQSGLHSYNFEEFVAGCLCFSFAFFFVFFNLIGPKFGKKRVDGGFAFPGSSIVAKLGLVGMLLIVAQLALLCWLVSN